MRPWKARCQNKPFVQILVVRCRQSRKRSGRRLTPSHMYRSGPKCLPREPTQNKACHSSPAPPQVARRLCPRRIIRQRMGGGGRFRSRNEQGAGKGTKKPRRVHGMCQYRRIRSASAGKLASTWGEGGGHSHILYRYMRRGWAVSTPCCVVARRGCCRCRCRSSVCPSTPRTHSSTRVPPTYHIRFE